jgi:hypothetical protein
MYAVKTYGEVKVCSHSCLTSTLDGVEWQASRPKKRNPDTYWMRGSVGLRAGVDTWAREKLLSHDGNRTTIPQLSHPGYWIKKIKIENLHLTMSGKIWQTAFFWATTCCAVTYVRGKWECRSPYTHIPNNTITSVLVLKRKQELGVIRPT